MSYLPNRLTWENINSNYLYVHNYFSKTCKNNSYTVKSCKINEDMTIINLYGKLSMQPHNTVNYTRYINYRIRETPKKDILIDMI